MNLSPVKPGDVFGKLKVLSISSGAEIGRPLSGAWAVCRCACGRRHLARARHLKRMKSCGCIQAPVVPMGGGEPKRPARRLPEKWVIPIGTHFGRLTVIGVAPGGGVGQRCVCECSCGTIGTYTAKDLRAGRRSSCGGKHPCTVCGKLLTFTDNYRHLRKHAALMGHAA